MSPSKELRDASTEAESLFRDYRVESSMRLDVFQAKMTAEKNTKSSGEWDALSSEEHRLVDKMVLDGTRAGLALPEKERAELTILQKDLSQACLDFRVRCFIGFRLFQFADTPYARQTSAKKTYDCFKVIYSLLNWSIILGCDLIYRRGTRRRT